MACATEEVPAPMIVRPKPNLLGILFSLKGSIAKRIALRSLLVTLLASVIVLVDPAPGVFLEGQRHAVHIARSVAVDLHELSQ
jgi:predicted membrane chloride channel (bestrophin family)